MNDRKVITSTSYYIDGPPPETIWSNFSSPHPNVVLISDHVDDRPAVAVSHSKSLVDVMSDCFDKGIYLRDHFRKRLLLQITHGLNYLHNHDKVHGNVKNEQVWLSIDPACQYAVLVYQENDVQSKSLRNDVKQLADVFKYVLTNGEKSRKLSTTCQDYVIAQELIKDMRESISTTEILKHPFFWSDDKKINFLLRCTDFIEKLKKPIEPLNNRRASHERDWTDLLVLTDFEIGICTRKLGLCVRNEVRDLAQDNEKISNTSFGLLKFFRNKKTHFHEQNDAVKKSFLNNETSIYWQFFSKRYPDLLYQVYDVIKDYELYEGLREIYFDTECENAPLPNISEHEVCIFVYKKELERPSRSLNNGINRPSSQR